MISIPAGSSFVDSVPELDDINSAYEATAYKYDWPSLLTRAGIVKVANVDRYPLPATFRKARTVKLDGVTITETELEFLKNSRQTYAIDQTQDDIILYTTPSSASTAFTLSNSESAGSAVTIELDTVSGLTQLDEIFVRAASLVSEFTLVSSVGTLQITARLDSAKSANDVIYRVKDIVDILFYRTITLLSASGDTTLLPPAIDYIMLEKAASLAYARLEQFDESDRWEKMWERNLANAWLALDKNSTGLVTTFSI